MLRNHPENVSWLASIDLAHFKTQNKNEKTVHHFAAANDKTEIASVLLKSLSLSDKIFFISFPDNDGRTAFHRSCSESHFQFSKWLLEEYKNYKSESDPLLHTTQNNNGITPLMLALLSNHLEIVSWLVSIDPACMKIQNKKKKPFFVLQLHTTKLKLLLFS